MTARTKLRTLGILVAGLVGLLAIALPGTASARDRNHDKIPDRWERHHHLSLDKNQARRDQDRDSLRNRKEFKARTDPRDADTDDDGIDDDDENAGTIASFDGTTLTIDLFGGSSVSGTVTDETRIECQGNEGPGGDDQGDDDQGDDGDGDNSGPGGEDEDKSGPGDGDDDNSGPGNAEDCTTADLTPGTVVQEAELELSEGGATFEEVELVK